jgi:ribosomal protein S27AE
MLSLNKLNESLFDALDDYNLELNDELNDDDKLKNIKLKKIELDEEFCINCENNSIQNMKGELICSSCGYFSGIKIENGDIMDPRIANQVIPIDVVCPRILYYLNFHWGR